MAPNNSENSSNKSSDDGNGKNTDCTVNHQNSKSSHQKTKNLIQHLIIERSGIRENLTPLDELSRKSYAALRRLVDESDEKYGKTFTGMYKRIQVDPNDRDSFLESIRNIANRVLSDGCLTWGRLVAIIAFVSHIVRYTLDNGLVDSGFAIRTAADLSNYIDEELGTQINQLGGWEALEEMIPPQTQYDESLIRNGLLASLGGLGVCLLALFAVK